MNKAGRLVRGFGAVVLALGLSGCVHGGESTSVDAEELEGIVLQQEDVPDAFMSFDAGSLQSADRPRGETGWKARYRRPGSPSTRGPLVIESRVDRFADAEAAEESLAAVVREARAGDWSDVDAPQVGEESHAFRQLQEAVAPVQYFMLAWRHANVVASVTASGFSDKVTLDEVIELARAQQARTEAASA